MSQRERKREGGHELTTERLVLEEKGGIVLDPNQRKEWLLLQRENMSSVGGVAQLCVGEASGPPG